jgi:hypothetical protein
MKNERPKELIGSEKKAIKTHDGHEYRIPILPIPVEFDYVPEDIYPLTGGGFECYMCGEMTESSTLADLKHKEWCSIQQATKSGTHYPTHGEARAAYQKEKAMGSQ